MSNLNKTSSKKPAKKQALGRGLGSLLGSSEPEVEEIEINTDDFVAKNHSAMKMGFKEEEKTSAPAPAPAPRVPDELRIHKMAIENLFQMKDQPRQFFDKTALGELAQSIRENGILQPIVVRPLEGETYEIIAGERRWRAAQICGLTEVPVIIRSTEDRQALELALIENIQREDLNPIEEAEAYSLLMTDYNMTQQEMAEKVGKERATVANLLRLLQLAPEVREFVKAGEISSGMAKVLLQIPDLKLQKQAARKVVKSKLTVRAAEKLVKKLKDPSAPTAENSSVSEKLAGAVAEELQKLLGTKVKIDYHGKKSKVSIQFYSDEAFNEFVEQVRRTWQK